jgi:hypothetical protein
MLTLAGIRTPERVLDPSLTVHHYGGAMRPAATHDTPAAPATSIRAMGC